MVSGRGTAVPKSLAALLFVLGFLVGTQQSLRAQGKEVPYVPTPDIVVDRMLEVADVGPGDYVVDLGSGDGRIVIAAVQRGAAGYGIDIDAQRVSEARLNAKNIKVDDRVVFQQGDIFEEDFSEASVVTMYLLPEVNRKLRLELLDQLEPGTRIVSPDYNLGAWESDRHETIRNESLAGYHEVYYWVVPARVDGEWKTTVDGVSLTLRMHQFFQELDVTLSGEGDNKLRVKKSTIHGERFEIEVTGGDVQYLMNGRVDGNKVIGNLQVNRDDGPGTVQDWEATRL